MKVRNKQLYSNECGLCAIKNLLYFNNIKDDNVDLDFQKEGCSIKQMMTTLKRYFFEVKTCRGLQRYRKNARKTSRFTHCCASNAYRF